MTGLDEYQIAAMRTAVPATKIMPTPEQMELLYSALAIAGEAGEFVELVKKHVFHGKPLDGLVALKELGDVLWGIAHGARSLGTPLSEVGEENIKKLTARYPDGYVPGGGIR